MKRVALLRVCNCYDAGPYQSDLDFDFGHSRANGRPTMQHKPIDHHRVYGFSSINQFLNWFTAEEVIVLDINGFYLRAAIALSENIHREAKHVNFIPEYYLAGTAYIAKELSTLTGSYLSTASSLLLKFQLRNQLLQPMSSTKEYYNNDQIISTIWEIAKTLKRGKK